MFYVYELADSRTDEVFYVGKGRGNRRFRHEREARAGAIGPKCDRIREIIGGGGCVDARTVCHFENEDDAFAHEAELIGKHGIDNLTNICVGGAGGRRRLTDADEARKIIRTFAPRIRSASDLIKSGCKLMLGPYDLTNCTKGLVDRLRERAGEEYFEQHVGAI